MGMFGEVALAILKLFLIGALVVGFILGFITGALIF